MSPKSNKSKCMAFGKEHASSIGAQIAKREANAAYQDILVQCPLIRSGESIIYELKRKNEKH